MARTGKTRNRVVQVRGNTIRITLGPKIAEKIGPPSKGLGRRTK